MARRALMLSESDAEIIREFIDWWRSQRGNPANRPDMEELLGNLLQPPEVHLVRVPSGGVPALTEEAGAGIEDTPGTVDCTPYVLDRFATPHKIKPGSAQDVPVYNLSTTAIAGDVWVPAVRDKYGAFFAISTGGGAFTAKEIDGTPSSASEIQFPNTSLGTSGAAVVVLEAGISNAGLISLSGTAAAPQVIGDGVKAFQDPVELITNFATNNSYVLMTGSGGTTPSFKIEMVNAGTTASRFTFTSTGLQINDLLVTGYNFQLTLGATPAITFPELGVTAVPGTSCTLRVGGDLGTTQQVGALSRTVAAGGAYFFVGATNGITASKTVKDGAGANQTVTITGGIITGWT